MTDDRRITTIRAPHDRENKFFIMARQSAQDKVLSWEARGVLCYLLSQRDDWKVLVSNLKQNCGRDKVYKIIDELEAAGYLKKERLRRPDGTYEAMSYRVFELPSLCEPLPEKPDTDNQEVDEPFTENPDTDLPDTAKPIPVEPQVISIESLINTESEIETEEKTTTTTDVVVVPASEEVSDSQSKPLDITPQFKQVNPDFARISRAYEQNIGIVSAAIRDRLNMALTDFPADWIVEAIEEAVAREKRFWSYVDAILKNWKRDGKNKKPPTGSAAPSPMPDSNTEAFIAAQSESESTPLTPPDASVNTTVGKYGKTALEAWNAAYSQLEHTYDRATFMTWIQDARLIQVDAEGAFVIEAKNDYAMSVCRDRLYRAIHRTVADCYGDEVRLEFVSRTPTPADPLEKIGERMKRAKAAERDRLAREQGDAA